jgi:hypothetical protein
LDHLEGVGEEPDAVAQEEDDDDAEGDLGLKTYNKTRLLHKYGK